MRKIEVALNRTLKLSNVISVSLNENTTVQPEVVIRQMEDYIKSKGAMPVGPVVQQVCVYMSDDKLKTEVRILRQSNIFINHIEYPYLIESVHRVKQCIFAHYIGPEEKIGVACDKINVAAFENDIELKGSTYTVFLDRRENDDIVADVFMETI